MRLDFRYKPNKRQLLAHNAIEKHILYGGAVGGGKLLALDTAIPTPIGWTTMGELRVGDIVFAASGEPSPVIAVSKTSIGKQAYEVVFSDGSIIVADAEHLWETQTLYQRSNNKRRSPAFRAKRRKTRQKEVPTTRPGKQGMKGKHTHPELAHRNVVLAEERRNANLLKKSNLFSICTTEEILATLHTGKNLVLNHSVRCCDPLNLPEANLPIDPYLFGAWLGDGTSRCGVITQCLADRQVIARAAGNWPGRVVMHKGNKTGKAWCFHGLTTALRKLGVLNNKHIPQQYLRASFEQRLELLRGLLDTDGGIVGRGQVGFSTTSCGIRDGMAELLVTMGIKSRPVEHPVTLYGKDCGISWRFSFVTDLSVFALLRKVKKQKRTGLRGTHRLRYIVDVRPVPTRHLRCVSIAHPSHLYLAGRTMIPTHNSVLLVNDAIRQCIFWEGNAVGIFRWELSAFKKTTYQALREWLLEPNEEIAGNPQDLIEQHNQQDHWIQFYNGSRIYYGGLKPSASVSGDILAQIKSFEVNTFYLDELTDFPEKVYRFAGSRVPRVKCRNIQTEKMEYPPGRIISASNPALGWVKQEFIDQDKPNHRFIKSTIRDNAENLAATYEADLRQEWAGMDEKWIEQYIDGSWDAVVDFECIYQAPWLARAVGQTVEDTEPVEFGLDVATFGGDRIVCMMRKGFNASIIIDTTMQDTVTTTDQVCMLADRYQPELIKVDAIGEGRGVYDMLAARGYPVSAFIGGARPNDDRFFNLRAEAYWELRTLLQKGLIHLPDNSKLINEMGTVKYLRRDKTIQVEAKDALKKRLGHSPDYADAAIYCFYGASYEYVTSVIVGADG